MASTASVADGATAAIRAEMRLPVTPAPRGAPGPVSVCWAMSAMIPYVTDTPDIRIPASLLPADGRFGAGPSKVRPEAVQALAAASGTYLGTSHRQKTVKNVVGSLRAGLTSLFSLPDGYEVVLGNGGTTCFWDAATFGLIEHRSQHLTFGEFSSKFATAAAAAPHLGDPEVISSEVGTHPLPVARDDIDLYALTHNETSTGVDDAHPAARGRRPAGRRRGPGGRRRHLGRRRPAGRPDRVRRLLLRPPEVLRLRRRAVGGPALPRGRRADRRRSPPPAGGSRPPWT